MRAGGLRLSAFAGGGRFREVGLFGGRWRGEREREGAGRREEAKGMMNERRK